MLPSRLRPSRVVLNGDRHNLHLQLTRIKPVLSSSARWIGTRGRGGILVRSQTPFYPGPFKVGGASVRGKKTTVVSLADLPQGVIRSETLPPLEPEPPAAPAYPTVMLQVLRNMKKFDNCVVLTRVGGFYELYFENAEECGPLLNLKVVQRRTAAGPVAMVSLHPSGLRSFITWHSSTRLMYRGGIMDLNSDLHAYRPDFLSSSSTDISRSWSKI